MSPREPREPREPEAMVEHVARLAEGEAAEAAKSALLKKEQDDRDATGTVATIAAAPLLEWHAKRHRSRALTEDEGRMLEYGNAPQLGIRPSARMTIATRAFWSMSAEQRSSLLAAAPSELDATGRELHALKTLYDAVSAEVPEGLPADLCACNAHVKTVLDTFAAPAKA